MHWSLTKTMHAKGCLAGMPASLNSPRLPLSSPVQYQKITRSHHFFRGLSAKEMFYRRNLTDNSPLQIEDSKLSSAQQSNRARSHRQQEKNLTPQPEGKIAEKGDRVFIREDLNKLRGREEHLVVDKLENEG